MGARSRKLSPTEQLVADVVAAGGVLRVRRSAGPSEYKLHELIRNANRFGKVPPGKLLVSRFVDDESEQYLQWLEIRLEDGPEGTDAPLQPVPVPDEVTRLHPAVAVLRKRGALTVSTSLRTRALRILHAIAVEAERRGYEVGSGRPGAADESDEAARPTVHLVITVDDTKVPLVLSEEQNRVEHVMTRRELAEQRRSLWTGFPTHDYVPSGRLRIDLAAGNRGSTRQGFWADRASHRLEEKLPELLREVVVRASELRLRREARVRAEAEYEAALVKEEERARERAAEIRRRAVLDDHLRRWKQARALTAYADAVEKRTETGDEPAQVVADAHRWLSWVHEQIAAVDPLKSLPGWPVADDLSSSELEKHVRYVPKPVHLSYRQEEY